MTKEAAVKFELNSSLHDWTKFTSHEVELAGFKWFVSGEYIGCGAEKINRRESGGFNYNCKSTKFTLRNTVIHCAPVERKETSIWSCEAKGEIVAFANSHRLQEETKRTMTYSKLWSHRFTFQNPKSVAMEIDFHKMFSEVPQIYYVQMNGERMYSELEVRVKISSHANIDLCIPDNKMLKSPEDAAKVIVEGKTLWLSREVLGGASPFFRRFFTKKRRAKEFRLSDVKLDEFMCFVSILYNVQIDIDKTSLEYLLRLEDIYKCEAVRSKCHAFLVATDTLTPQEKLRIGDRFRFEDVIDTAIQKMDVQDLKNFGMQTELETYSHRTICNILKAVSGRLS